MLLSPTRLHQATRHKPASRSSPFYALAGDTNTMPVDPASSIASSIAGAVDSIFGTIGTAVQGKTQKDLMRQNGNQQLQQSAIALHSQRLSSNTPPKKRNSTTAIVVFGFFALLVLLIILFTLRSS